MFSPVLERVQNNSVEHLIPNETKMRPIGLHHWNPRDRNPVGSDNDRSKQSPKYQLQSFYM